jgi:hypothetical protein
MAGQYLRVIHYPGGFDQDGQPIGQGTQLQEKLIENTQYDNIILAPATYLGLELVLNERAETAETNLNVHSV